MFESPDDSRQRECDERVARFGFHLSRAAGRDDDVLTAVDHVGRWRRVAAGGKRVFPKQLSGLFVEGVDAFVFGRAMNTNPPAVTIVPPIDSVPV